MCYFIIQSQLNIEYIRIVALFVLQTLDLKMMSNFLQKNSERQLFWELIYGHYVSLTASGLDKNLYPSCHSALDLKTVL